MLEVARVGNVDYLPSKLKEYEEEFLSILAAEASLYEFTKQAWPYVVGGGIKRFRDGWHIKAICDHLEAITRGQIKKLLINIPPRMTKSLLVSVMWPCWWWANDPTIQFLCGSGGMKLAIRDSVACQNLINSHWYQTRWGHKVKIAKGEATKTKFVNTEKGFREITSVNSKVTGLGGDVRIMDDPNDAGEAESEVVRESTNEWFSGVFASRVTDYENSIEVLIMQRVHEMDVTGYILGRELVSKNWTKLILPMEFETKRRCKTIILPSTHGKIWQDPRTKEGELLCPERIGEKTLKELKDQIGSEYKISGQFQQSPAPGEGGLIKGNWFSVWKKDVPPARWQTIQSWDTGMTEKNIQKNSYSACTTWGLFDDDHGNTNIILLSMWRGHVGYPDLRRMAQRLYADYRDTGETNIITDSKHVPDFVFIEAKATGTPLIADLREAGIIAIPYEPRGDKTYRVQTVTHIIEAGRVWLPGKPPLYNELREYARVFKDACTGFPNLDSRDLVDTMTQVLNRVMGIGGIKNPTDKKWQDDTWKPSHGFYGNTRDE